MSLSTRLTWWFVALLALALFIVLILSYHELVLEQGSGHPEDYGENPEPLWWQLGEIALRAAIPLLVLAVGGCWLARRALRPLHTLSEAAARIHEGNLGEKIPLSGRGDELDCLTAVFNDMTARLAASFSQIREFTLHANHELKTPLAILRSEIVELLEVPQRTESEREQLASLVDEVDRLTRIVNGLTLLTRADAKQLKLSWEPVALDTLVREAAENCEALAEPAGINVTCLILHPAEVHGDRHRLRQLMLILCDNAIKYNHPGGTVAITLGRVGPHATVHVRNTGPGIPLDEQPRVFQRFHRGSSATTLDIEGCGLGLSIALSISQLHRATLSFSSDSEWTEFVLTFLDGALSQPEFLPDSL